MPSRHLRRQGKPPADCQHLKTDVSHLFLFPAIAFCFSFIFKHFHSLLEVTLSTFVFGGFLGVFLYFLHGEYVSIRQALLAVPGLPFGTAYSWTAAVVTHLYCVFPYSPRWSCRWAEWHAGSVIGGMVIQDRSVRRYLRSIVIYKPTFGDLSSTGDVFWYRK